MYSIIKLCAILILHQSLVIGHTFHLGENCAKVQAVSNFDIGKFTGIWYAIEKTSTTSRCLLYNITTTDLRKTYDITQVGENALIGLVKTNLYRYQGNLQISDDGTGALSVKFPLSLAGSSSFVVFDTDYKTYAGVYSCQKIGFTHRQAALILSRQPTLDDAIVSKLRERLMKDQVNPFDLSVISQEGCKYDAKYLIDINDQTFTKENFKKQAKAAAHAIAEGADFVYKGAKKLYYYVKDSPNNEGGNRRPTHTAGGNQEENVNEAAFGVNFV